MEILVATNNRKKLAEINRLLESAGHTLVTLSEAGITPTREEDGAGFADNAFIKAGEACELSGMAALADDSGLCVDALGGAPGVLSARFAGGHGDDAANNQKLLHLMQRVPEAQRTAQFVCVIALVLPNGAGMQVEGRCSGHIGFAPSGTNGFGYDPLFYVNGRSFADMTDDEKNEVSHRAAALRRFAQELPGFIQAQEMNDG